MMALSKGADKSDNETTETLDSSQIAPAESRRGLPKVASGLNIANIYTEAKEGAMQQKEMTFKSSM
jgi:hypothetical protein